MGTIYHCLVEDKRTTPPTRRLVYEAPTERKAVEYLESHGGGVYRNLLNNFEMPVKAGAVS